MILDYANNPYLPQSRSFWLDTGERIKWLFFVDMDTHLVRHYGEDSEGKIIRHTGTNGHTLKVIEERRPCRTEFLLPSGKWVPAREDSFRAALPVTQATCECGWSGPWSGRSDEDVGVVWDWTDGSGVPHCRACGKILPGREVLDMIPED
jgi:hypothetical protein